jgi:YbbR domain-containing protein
MMDRFLRNNNVLRILALVLACILWLVVHTPDTTQEQKGITEHYPSMPIHVEVGSNMVVSTMNQSTATVNVTTSLNNVPMLFSAMSKVQLVVNAQGLSPGQHTLRIFALNMPDDIQDIKIDPETVNVVLEKEVDVEKPINIQIKGKPADGYALGSLKMNTQSAIVSGARSAVKKVAQVAATVDVGGLKSADTKIVKLTPVDADGRAVDNVELSPSSISVEVPVEATEDTLKLQPEVTGSPAPGYAVSNVTLSETQVSETGLAKDQLPPNGLNVPVDVTGLTASKTFNVTVPLLEGITKVVPDTVQATVTVEPMVTKTFKQVSVSVQNVPKGLNVTLKNSPKVNVTLSGPATIMQGLTAKDVQAYVDASTLKSGMTKARVTVQAPKWVEAANISPQTVAVQVQGA